MPGKQWKRLQDRQTGEIYEQWIRNEIVKRSRPEIAQMLEVSNGEFKIVMIFKKLKNIVKMLDNMHEELECFGKDIIIIKKI